MARFFIDDSSGEDKRSLLNTQKFAQLMGSAIPVVAPRRKYMHTNAQSGTFSLTIDKDLIFRVGPHMCYTNAAVQLSSANLHQLSGNDFVNGHDYAVFAYLSPDAIANKLDESMIIIDCANELPKGYDENTCICLGGFHYGYTATYDAGYKLTGAAPHLGVLEFSIWTVLHRVAYPDNDLWTNNRGLTYVPPINKWVGIFKGLDASSKFPSFGIAPTLINAATSDPPYKKLVEVFAGGRRWRPCTLVEYTWSGYGSPDTADNNTNAWTATSNTAPNTNGSVMNAVSLYGCKDIMGGAYEAFYDPSGFIDKVLCSSTTFNSGGGHKLNEICWHTTTGFSFRVCADNCY